MLSCFDTGALPEWASVNARSQGADKKSFEE